MAFTNTPFVDGNAITESDLKGRIGNFETWLNGGAIAGDLSHGEWVKKGHVLRPEFIGGSDDRAEFCTGTTRYRVHAPGKVGAEVFHAESRSGGSGSGNDNWEPVNGLNTIVKAYRPVTIVYTASWLAWETGADLFQTTSAAAFRPYNMDNPNYKVADFALYSQKIDGSSLTKYEATRRSLYAGININFDAINPIGMWAYSTGKQMSTHYVFDLTAGIYNVGIRCNTQGTTGEQSQNIFVRTRSCVVDAHFNSAT